MKILQLCKKFPYPAKDGESIAILSLAQALKQHGCEIVLMAMNTTKHFVEDTDAIRELDCFSEVYTVNVDNRIQIKEAISNLFSKDSYHISRFESNIFDEKLKSVLTLHQFDVVQMETLYLAPYLETVKQHSDAIVSLRAHNVEHEIWKRVTENTPFIPKKVYLKYLTGKLKNYEIAKLNGFDFIVAISNRDLISFKSMGYKNGAIFTPVGIDANQYTVNDSARSKDKFKIGFIGSLDWLPNVNGVDWFLDQVWPKLKTNSKNIELHIAGRNTPSCYKNMGDDHVVVHGEVEDAHDFMNACDVMIVPLFSGSGMRVKILESMALGKVVLTTSVGLEGINAKHGREIILANNAQEFLDELLDLFNNNDKIDDLSTKAVDFIEQNYNYVTIAKKLHDSYAQLIEQSTHH